MDDHPAAADPAADPAAHDQAGAPPDAALAEYLDGILALAESLNELPLDGVEPLLGPPRWA